MVEAAGKLGVDPAVLVAQSALETGWAGRWCRPATVAAVTTCLASRRTVAGMVRRPAVRSLEFRDGVAALEKASFRVYDSLSNSFDDYVSFLQNNPRYQQALAKVADTRQFLTELQDARDTRRTRIMRTRSWELSADRRGCSLRRLKVFVESCR